MCTVTEQIREHLLESCGCVDATRRPSLEELRETRWVPEFEQLMRNRLILGAFRHADEDFRRRPTAYYDNVSSMQKRLERYLETGDVETLVDVANLCMLEYRYSMHPRRHMSDGGGDHDMHVRRVS